MGHFPQTKLIFDRVMWSMCSTVFPRTFHGTSGAQLHPHQRKQEILQFMAEISREMWTTMRIVRPCKANKWWPWRQSWMRIHLHTWRVPRFWDLVALASIIYIYISIITPSYTYIYIYIDVTLSSFQFTVIQVLHKPPVYLSVGIKCPHNFSPRG